MKQVVGCTAALLLMIGCASEPGVNRLESEQHKNSYVIGLDVGSRLRRTKEAELDFAAIAQGIRDSLSDGAVLLVPSDSLAVLRKEFARIAFLKRNDTSAVTSAATIRTRQLELPFRTALQTHLEKMNYAMGVDIGASIKRTGADIDVSVLMQGVVDTVFGYRTILSQDSAKVRLARLAETAKVFLEKRHTAMRDSVAAESAAFLVKNGARSGVQTTSSGLQYEVLASGKGNLPVSGGRVKVRYSQSLADGTPVIDSKTIGDAVIWSVDGVLKGIREGLLLSRAGGRYRLYVSSELAYGDSGHGTVAPGALLIVEFELLEVFK